MLLGIGGVALSLLFKYVLWPLRERLPPAAPPPSAGAGGIVPAARSPARCRRERRRPLSGK